MNSSEEQERKSYIDEIDKLGISYHQQADIVFTMHLMLQIVTLVGAIILPIIVSFSEIPKPVPTIISAVVAIAAGLTAFLGLGSRARTLYSARESLQRESREFKLGVGVYSQPGQNSASDKFALFVTRVEATRFQEEQNRITAGIFGNVSTGSSQAVNVPVEPAQAVNIPPNPPT